MSDGVQRAVAARDDRMRVVVQSPKAGDEVAGVVVEVPGIAVDGRQ